MHLIDHSTAAPGNQFTDGNAQTGIPSTRVTAKWLNSVQNELANFITSRGIVLDEMNQGQLTEAIVSAIESYGAAPVAIPNNTSIWTDLGITLDKDKIKSSIIVIDTYRKTATKEICTMITLKPTYLPNLGEWKLLPVGEESFGELSGITLQITPVDGKVQFKSSDLSGGSYEGFARYKITSFNLA